MAVLSQREQTQSWDRAVEACVTEGEDPSVTGHEPVARVACRSNAHHWPLQSETARRTVELSEPKVKMPPSDPTSQ